VVCAFAASTTTTMPMPLLKVRFIQYRRRQLFFAAEQLGLGPALTSWAAVPLAASRMFSSRPPPVMCASALIGAPARLALF
jgi:hypothetical protein